MITSILIIFIDNHIFEILFDLMGYMMSLFLFTFLKDCYLISNIPCSSFSMIVIWSFFDILWFPSWKRKLIMYYYSVSFLCLFWIGWESLVLFIVLVHHSLCILHICVIWVFLMTDSTYCYLFIFPGDWVIVFINELIEWVQIASEGFIASLGI